MSKSEMRPAFIGIAGGTGSGKSVLAARLRRSLGGNGFCSVIAIDGYYRAFDPNYDDPSSINFDRLVEDIDRLRRDCSVQVPVYRKHVDKEPFGVKQVRPAPFIVVEGMFALWHRGVRNRLTVRIFVDEEPDVRAIRRIQRDVLAYKLELKEVCAYYLATVRPKYDEHIAPTKREAELVVPPGSLEMRVKLVLEALEARGLWRGGQGLV